MLYILDANNLSGALDLLDEDAFDTILSARVKAFFAGKKTEAILVFDSLDPLGDKYRDGNLEIVYTPRDNYYHNADDKVLEIIENYLANQKFNGEIKVVTDDIELRSKIKFAMGGSNNGWRVKLVRATDFAEQIKLKENGGTQEEKENINDEDFNNELLKIWGKR